MEKYRLQLKLKDGQNLGYIQMDNGEPYYDYGYSEATLFDPVGVLSLLNKTPFDKYDVFAEVPYTTDKGRKGKTALRNEELKTYMQNELNDKTEQVMENKIMNDYKIRLVDGDFVEINSADYTDLVDANFETSLGEYGVARNPQTGETIIGAVPGDGVIAAYEIRTISLDDVKDALDDIDQGFYDFSDVTPAEYDSALTEDHLAQAILDINSYSGDFTPFVTHDMVSDDMQDAGLVAIEDEEPVAESKINEEMYDELGNAITPEEYAKGVADGTINEDMKTVKEHLADRLKELGWENLDKVGVEKEIKKMQGKGWYDKYTLDMTLLQHLKEFGNDLTEMYDEYGNHITPEEYAKGVADGTINESVEDETDDKALALEDYLINEGDLEEGEVIKKTDWDENEYQVGDYDNAWTYKVYSSYEDAKQAAVDYEKQTLEEIGIGALNWNYMPYEIGHYVARDWFQAAMEESNQYYIDDIRNESASSDEFENRLEEEMADAGVETEEEYLEHLNNNYADPIDWYKDNFGEEDFGRIAVEKNLVDLDAVAEAVVEADGPANALAGYDGKEIEWEFNGNTYYMYRNN